MSIDGPPFLNTAQNQPKSKLVDTLPKQERVGSTTSEPVDIKSFRDRRNNSASSGKRTVQKAPTAQSNVVQLESWKQKIGKAIMGDDIHSMLEQESKVDTTPPQNESAQTTNKVPQEKNPDSFTERKQESVQKPIASVEEKYKEVQKCVYIEQLIEECLPRVGIVSSDRGIFSPQDLKEILYKAYMGKVPLDEVPLNFGIRAKVVELMKKNGQTAFGEEKPQAPAETVKEELQQKPQEDVVPGIQEPEEEMPVIEEIHDVVDADTEEEVPEITTAEVVSPATEAWKETRDQYKAYRKKVKDAEKDFLEKTQAFEEERRNTGVLARLMATPELDASKKEMLKAQFKYDALLEGLRGERQKRMESFVEKQCAKKGTENPEESSKSAVYVARHEAILERHIDNEVQKLESLRYQENEKSESRYRLVRGMKAGFNWYRNLSSQKRLVYGVGLSAVAGGALGLAGVYTGGMLAVGGVMAGRRAVGGILGSLAAITTKKYGDKTAEEYGTRRLEEEHEEFAKKKIGDSRKDRLAINKNVRTGKHVATASAGVAAFLTGAGVANSSSSIFDSFGVGSAQASTDVPEIATKDSADESIHYKEKYPGKNTPLERVSVEENAFPALSKTRGMVDDLRPDSGEKVEIHGQGKDAPPVKVSDPKSVIDEHAHEYKPGTVEESSAKNITQEKIPAPKDFTVFEGSDHSMLEGKTKSPLVDTGLPKTDITDPETHRVGETIPSHRADITDPETHRVGEVASSYKADVTDPETYRVGETTPLYRTDITDPETYKVGKTAFAEVQPEVFTIEGTYEEGSSVEGELNQFLENNTWIHKEYPDLTEVERGKVAHLLRLELMKDPAMAERLKIHGGDWDKVWKNERYDITIDREFIEREVEKIHTSKVEPIETKAGSITIQPLEVVEAPKIEMDIQDILEDHGISEAGPENMSSIHQGGAYYKQFLPSQEVYPSVEGGAGAPETIEMKGAYENGSSVDKELQQFLKENTWVTKEYPNLTDAERGTIASLLRLELMKNPAMAEQFKVRNNDWTKVVVNDTYDITLDRKVVESQIEKVHPTGKVMVPESEKQPQKVFLEAKEVKKIIPQESAVGTEPTEPIKIEAEKTKVMKSYEEYASEKREKMRIKMFEEAQKHRVVTRPDVERIVIKAPEEGVKRIIPVPSPEEQTPDVPAPQPAEEVGALKIAKEDLAQAGKILEESKADYKGENSRGSLDTLLKKYDAFDTKIKAQRPLILSSWGPISYARMQDIFDGKGSISYTIGDEKPIMMGRQVETLTRSIVEQLQNNLQEKVPNIEEVLVEAKNENWTLGELVKKLSATLEEQEKATTAPEVPTPEIVPDAPQEMPRVVPITEYERPVLQPMESNGEQFLVAKLAPIEVTDEVKKIVEHKYLEKHPAWTSGNAEELYTNKDLTDFRYVVDVCKADIAADVSGDQIPIPSITIDWSAFKDMTPAEVLAQFEQQHRILADENTTISRGEVIQSKTF
jgi:hypothetical protein